MQPCRVSGSTVMGRVKRHLVFFHRNPVASVLHSYTGRAGQGAYGSGLGKGGWTGGPRVWARRGALRVLLIHERVVHKNELYHTQRCRAVSRLIHSSVRSLMACSKSLSVFDSEVSS